MARLRTNMALRLGCLLVLMASVSSVKMHAQLRVNPVRRVITMLQMMQKKVTEEGDAEKELFDKFMCYCRTTQNSLTASISAAETKIPQLESDSQAKEAEKAQLANDIVQATKDRAAAQKSMSEAKSIREKEAKSAKAELDSSAASVAAMTSALTALRKGASGAFLQTSGAAILRRLVMQADLPEWDRQTLSSYLSVGSKARSDDSSEQESDEDAEQNEPASGDIIGIISQLKETTEKNILETKADEKKAVEDYDALVVARTREITALTKELETKKARVGEVGVELVNTAQDLSDTKKQLDLDQKMLTELQTNCKKKGDEWDERSKTRAEELVALADTIKILNSDETGSLFRKVLPGPSLLQVQVSSKELLQEARQALTASPGRSPRDPRVSLIAMTMKGRKVNFDKVVGMIDKMITLLGKEQKDDDQKKAYCTGELDKADDEKKTLEVSIADGKKTVANSKELVKTLTEEIAKIAAGIADLDKSVGEATQQRKKENSAYTEELAANNAAVEILGVAKNRLNKFYNPGTSLRQEDATKAGKAKGRRSPHGGGAGSRVVQEAFSFLQASRGKRSSSSAASLKALKEKSSGVLAMIDTITKDIKKQITEMKVQEKESQADYESFMKESSAKRAADARGIAAKESAKAGAEAKTQKHSKELKASNAEALANAEYLQGLHVECDWFQKNYGVRQDARTSEIDALKQAKAVLSGADYSFLQVQEEVKYNLRRQSRR